jgi:hypothetical protein
MILITAVRIVILIVTFVLLLQMWRIFRSLPQNEPIGDTQSIRLLRRIHILAVCAVIQFILSIIQIFLR